MPAFTKASLNLSNQGKSPLTMDCDDEAIFSHQYSSECERMLSQFVDSLDSSLDSDRFSKVLHRTEEPYIHIFQDPKVSYGYKVIARLDCKPELAFEYMLDVERWKQWDDLCECAEIIEAVDPVTRFQYIRTKPIWPISARDVLLFSTMKKLEDGKYIMVGKSMAHEKCPTKKGVLRMDVGFLGMCVFSEPDDDTKCRVVFVADGDPKGWVPKNIVKFVATNAMPLSLRMLSNNLGSMSPIEYNLVSVLNSLAEHKPSTRSPLLSSLRSSILRLSTKSPNNAKSRVSIISSFLLNSKSGSYHGSHSSTSIKPRSISTSRFTRGASARPGSPPSAQSVLTEKTLPIVKQTPTPEPKETLPPPQESYNFTSSVDQIPSLTDSSSLTSKSKSLNPSDSDMTTTLASSTTSPNTEAELKTKRRRSLLVNPKQVTDKLCGKLRRMKTRVRNAMTHSKPPHEEFNEKSATPVITQYPNNSSPGLKVACVS